jgi:ribosomal-protein-alanine N-acetyltransferase
MALGGPPDAAMIVDDGFSEALLVMRMAADEAEILNFGVVPPARRKGLGRELLGAALALARQLGIKRIFLEVAAGNTAARALYAGCGFTQAGRRRDYYLQPDGTRIDALILSRGV